MYYMILTYIIYDEKQWLLLTMAHFLYDSII